MDFFKNKWVKVVAWIVFFASIAVLMTTGATAVEIETGFTLALAAVSAVSAIIAFITERSTAKKS